MLSQRREALVSGCCHCIVSVCTKYYDCTVPWVQLFFSHWHRHPMLGPFMGGVAEACKQRSKVRIDWENTLGSSYPWQARISIMLLRF